MRKLLRLGLAALLAGVALTANPVSAAIPTVTLESQAWWAKGGIDIPGEVGHHIHVQATIPRPGTIVNGRVDIPFRAVLHDQVGSPNWIRWSDGSNVIGSIATSRSKFSCTTHDGFTDCVWEGVLPVDFARFGTGLRELRISLNVPDEQPDGLPGSDSGAQRMFNSTGWQVCVRACSPVAVGGRSINFTEARGWYTGHDYANARLTTSLDTVRAGGTIGVRLGPGSGGDATEFSGVYVDPDMHRHNAGRVLLTRNAAFTGNVTIPADLAAGPHSLVLVSSDGQNAGVLRIPFTVGSGGGPTPSPTPPPTPTVAPPTSTPVVSTPTPPVCTVP